MGKKLVLIIISLMILIIPFAFADVPQNDTVNISLVIKDAPNITSIVLNDDDFSGLDNDIDLIENNNKTIGCNMTIVDLDGLTDLNLSSFQVVIKNTSYIGVDNIKFQNTFNWTDCTNTTIDENTTNVFCTYDAPHFTEPGEWVCNASISDIDGQSFQNEDNATMNELIALNISRPEIDFGGLAPGKNKTGSEYNFTVQNIGNVALDFDVNAYGSTQFDAHAMDCDTNFMSEDSLRYSLSSGSFDTYSPLDNTVGFDTINANLAEQNDFLSISTRDVFWGVEVKETDNVEGSCTGHIFVNAVKSN